MNRIRRKRDGTEGIRICVNVLTKYLPCVNGVHYICACSSYCRVLVIRYFGMKNMLLFSKYRLLGDDFILLLSCDKII
jgi:hypothetical protein